VTTVINLYGASGVGKSTTAAATFAKFKMAGKSIELVSEYIKQWAWQDIAPTEFDQLYIFGKQARKESILYNKVDYIITDSPLWLSAFYEQLHLGREVIAPAVKNYTDFVEEKGVRCANFFLERNKPYDPRGRYETKEQSERNQELLKEFLNKNGVALKFLDCSDEFRANAIYTEVT